MESDKNQLLAEFLEIPEVKTKLTGGYYIEEENVFRPNIATSANWVVFDWVNGAWWMFQKMHGIKTEGAPSNVLKALDATLKS